MLAGELETLGEEAGEEDDAVGTSPVSSSARGWLAETSTGGASTGESRCAPEKRHGPTSPSTVSPLQSERSEAIVSRSVSSFAIGSPSSPSGRSPTPMPQATRPGATCESERNALAVIAGWRVRGFVTAVPTRIVVVDCSASVE